MTAQRLVAERESTRAVQSERVRLVQASQTRPRSEWAGRQYLIDTALLAVCCGCLYFFAIGSSGLFDGIDSTSAETAREMVDSGNYVLPHLNFQLDFTKPILFDWLLACAYQVFGIGHFAARIWSAVFASISVGATYMIARALLNRKAALIAALVLACAPVMVVVARLSSADMVNNGFVTVALLALVNSVFLAKKSWSPVFYVSLALGTLTLGPISLLYFLFGSIAYVLVSRPSQVRLNAICRNLALGRGSIIFTAVALPWFILAGAASHGEWISLYVAHSLPHIVSDTSQLWLPISILLIGMIPTVAFLPAALKDTLTGKFPQSTVEQRHALTFLGAWVLSGLVWLPLVEQSSALGALPLLAPLAVLIGALLERWSEIKSSLRIPATWRNASLALAFAGPACACGGAFLLMSAASNEPTLLSQLGWIGLAVITVGSLAQYACSREGKLSYGIAAMCATTVISSALLSPIGFDLAYGSSQKDLVAIATQTEQHFGQLAIYKSFSPAAMFALKRPIDCVFDAKNFVVEPMRTRPLLIMAKQADAAELSNDYPKNVQQLDEQGAWRLLLVSHMRIANDSSAAPVYGTVEGTSASLPLTAGVPPSPSHFHRWL